MKTKIQAILLAVILSVSCWAAAVWVGSSYLETFMNGIQFGSGDIYKSTSNIPEFEDAGGTTYVLAREETDVDFTKITMVAGGSQAEPLIKFEGTSTYAGIYTNTNGNNLNFMNGGVQMLEIQASTIRPRASLNSNNGSITAPQYSFIGMNDGGIWRDTATDSLKMNVNGVVLQEWEDDYTLFSKPLQLTEDDSPVTPASGDRGLFFKTDGNLYSINSSGTETQIGQLPLNIIFQEKFEGTTTASDFTCDAPITVADETTDNIKDDTSISFTQVGASIGDQCDSQAVSLEFKEQGNRIEVCFWSTNDGDDDDLSMFVRDNSNGNATLVEIPIKASAIPLEHCGYFEAATNTASIDYDLEVVTVNNGAEVIIDDLSVEINKLTPIEVYASSEWETYTLDIGGMPNAVGFIESQRDGTHLNVRGYFDSSTGITGDLWEIELPTGLSIKSMGVTTYKEPVGRLIEDRNTNANLFFLATEGDTSVKVGYTDGSGAVNPTVERAANFIGTASTNYAFQFRVPIESWADTKQGVVVKGVIASDISNATDFRAQLTGSGGGVVTSFENLSFLDGACSRSATGRYRCDYITGRFAATPTLQITPQASGTSVMPVITAHDTTGFNLSLFTDAGGDVDAVFYVTASRSTDEVLESEKTIVFPDGIAPKTCFVKDVKVATDGGTFTSGAWRDRDLNTEDCDFLDLSSNAMVYNQSGDFIYNCTAPAYAVDDHKLRLQNETTATTLIAGDNNFVNDVGGDAATKANLMGKVTVSLGDSLKLQHRSTANNNDDGFGRTMGFGDDVYAQCEITKVR